MGRAAETLVRYIRVSVAQFSILLYLSLTKRKIDNAFLPISSLMQLQKVSGQLSEECSKGGRRSKKEDKEKKTLPEEKKILKGQNNVLGIEVVQEKPGATRSTFNHHCGLPHSASENESKEQSGLTQYSHLHLQECMVDTMCA